MEIIKTCRGGAKLVLDGETYTIKRKRPGVQIRWATKYGCKGAVTTDDPSGNARNGHVHNHGRSDLDVEIPNIGRIFGKPRNKTLELRLLGFFCKDCSTCHKMLYLRCLLQIQSKDYFPVQIVRAIVVQSLSGQEMDDAALVSSLMEVMSEVDQGLVENIRNGQLADNDEEMMDDFIIRVRSDSNAKRELDC